MKLHNYAGALQDCEMALAMMERSNPASRKAMFRKAQALAALGGPQRLAEAFLTLHEVAAQDSNNSEVSYSFVMWKGPGTHVQVAFHVALPPCTPQVRLLLQEVAEKRARAATMAAQHGSLEVQDHQAGGSVDRSVVLKSLMPPALLPFDYQPAQSGQSVNLLILLHGLGDVVNSYVALGKRMALPHVRRLQEPTLTTLHCSWSPT